MRTRRTSPPILTFPCERGKGTHGTELHIIEGGTSLVASGTAVFETMEWIRSLAHLIPGISIGGPFYDR